MLDNKRIPCRIWDVAVPPPDPYSAATQFGGVTIDVEPILPHNRNNREVHLYYLKHLKESVETLRKIVEEARIKKPLDNALKNACFYTKRSQELLEYVIGTSLKEFSKRDKKVATTPLNRNKQVAFREICKTSNNNTKTHVEQQKVHKTNVPVIPSTRVNSSTEASGSKPKSNTKNNRILPAKSDNKKKVEDHHRKNKSNLKQKNRVDSSSKLEANWMEIHFRTLVQIWDLVTHGQNGTATHSHIYVAKGFNKYFSRKCNVQVQCANACLQMQAANAMCICNMQMQCANACLQMQAANAMFKCNVHMQVANAMCKLQ
ncbi:hypothetical protein Tco_1031399 [Tanacetum coccineum]|uniref:Uncharacterized protein n=1 Tax=Tanacetum coccineum TaxID=301880 RepID=A0ABQ5GAM0_9ASTR